MRLTADCHEQMAAQHGVRYAGTLALRLGLDQRDKRAVEPGHLPMLRLAGELAGIFPKDARLQLIHRLPDILPLIDQHAGLI